MVDVAWHEEDESAGEGWRKETDWPVNSWQMVNLTTHTWQVTSAANWNQPTNKT